MRRWAGPLAKILFAQGEISTSGPFAFLYKHNDNFTKLAL